MSKRETDEDTTTGGPHREVRSFLMARDPSIDRRCRPHPTKKMRLFDHVEEEESSEAEEYESDVESLGTGSETTDIEKSTMHSTQNSNSSSGGSGTGASVYLRLRPVASPSNVYTILPEQNILQLNCPESLTVSNTNLEKQYSFTGIFNSEISQQELYEKCIAHQIESDDDLTILTYGTSGSGKTFTLLGEDQQPGIIPRSIEHVFSLYAEQVNIMPLIKPQNGQLTILEDKDALKETQIQKEILKEFTTNPQIDHIRLQKIVSEEHDFQTKNAEDVTVFIWVSFAEIYNEFVYDLLEPPTQSVSATKAPPPRKNLKIGCNNGEVFIKGLCSIFVRNSSDALRLLSYGLQRVNYAATAINSNSSRSHCIFFMDVIRFYSDGLSTKSSYKFCDLAGSERLGKTANKGARLKEAQRINTSLLVLGRCLNAANSGRKDIIPFRESKLTMLLQSALQGKEKLTMIVNVTPTDKYHEENINVLGFASIAQNIKFKKPVVSQNKRYSQLLNYTNRNTRYDSKCEKSQLLRENTFLRAELNMEKVKNQMALELQEQELRNELCDYFEKVIAKNKEYYESRLKLEIENLKRLHEQEIAALKRQHERELEDVDDAEELDDESDDNADRPVRRSIA